MSSDNRASTWDTLQQKTRQEIDSFPTQNALAIDHKKFRKAFRSFYKGKVAEEWMIVLDSRLMSSYNAIGSLVSQAILSSGQIDYLRPRLQPQIWEVGSLLLEVKAPSPSLCLGLAADRATASIGGWHRGP